MPSPPAALYCDEDVSVVLAAMLRARGFQVTTALDAGHLGQPDERQLQVAAEAARVLLTHNRADFERLHRQWLEAGRRHAGIIIARRRPGPAGGGPHRPHPPGQAAQGRHRRPLICRSRFASLARCSRASTRSCARSKGASNSRSSATPLDGTAARH